MGLVQLGHVAIEGAKLKANASRHKAMSEGRMKTAEPALAGGGAQPRRDSARGSRSGSSAFRDEGGAAADLQSELTYRATTDLRLIRLGFLDYVAAVRASGSDLLFPDLRARGAFTSLAGLFAKEFVKVRDQALPNAKAEGKTFHSFRHTFNSDLIDKISDVTRYRLMSHTTTDEGKRLDVNARVYSHYNDEQLLKALSTLPVYTAHLVPRVW